MAPSKKELIAHIQARTARVATGGAAARGKGNKHASKNARAYLATLPLGRFADDNPARFRKLLDRTTVDLQGKLPFKARRWGLARKLLNIFLRDSAYNTFLEREYDLERSLQLLEVPLDRISATALKREAGRGKLPAWPGVRKLSVEVSDTFQTFALALAEQNGIARAHLDDYWWGVRPED